MRALVTGATGFIGRHLIPALEGKGAKIIATALEPSPVPFPWLANCDYCPFDLARMDASENLFEHFGRPDMLFHLAWEGLPHYRELFHFEENLPRHYRFLKNLIEHGLSDVTVAGSCLEYGMLEGQLKEDMPTSPNTAYAVAKDTLRKFLLELQRFHTFSLKWPRLFYLFGPGQNRWSLIPQLEHALENQHSVFNMSKGDQLRDYLAVQDASTKLARIACQDKVDGIINCCSGVPITIQALVERHLKQRQKHIELNLGYYPYAEFEPRHFWGSTAKFDAILDSSQS